MCRKSLPSPRCRSELIDSAWVVIVPAQKYITKKHNNCLQKPTNKSMQISHISSLVYLLTFYILHITFYRYANKHCKYDTRIEIKIIKSLLLIVNQTSTYNSTLYIKFMLTPSTYNRIKPFSIKSLSLN